MVSELMKLNCWNVIITKTQPYDFAYTLAAYEVDVKNLRELCGDFVTLTSVVLAVYFAAYCEPCITQEKYKFQYTVKPVKLTTFIR